MSQAQQALDLARQHGMTLEANKGQLCWEALAESPVEILEVLRSSKDQILELLSSSGAAAVETKRPWSVDEWRVFFDERAGSAEFDDENSRDQAEAIAFKGCINEWLFQNPPAPHRTVGTPVHSVVMQ
jgi:hypothetical protein